MYILYMDGYVGLLSGGDEIQRKSGSIRPLFLVNKEGNSMAALVDVLTKEIEKTIKGSHYHLLEIKISKVKRFTSVLVYMDRDDGYLSHEDCKYLSNEMLDVIDAGELIFGNYRLDISSPGIGRPIKERWEFEKNIEKLLKVLYTNDDGVIREIKGELTEVNDDGITIKGKKTDKSIIWQAINKAAVKTPW